MTFREISQGNFHTVGILCANSGRRTCGATDPLREIFYTVGILCANSGRRACGATNPLREIFYTVGTVSALWHDNAYTWMQMDLEL